MSGKGTLEGHSRIRVFVEGPKAGDVIGACNVNSGVEKQTGSYLFEARDGAK